MAISRVFLNFQLGKRVERDYAVAVYDSVRFRSRYTSR